MGFRLNVRSVGNLVGIHHALLHVVRMAADRSDLEFIVTEGLRTPERQRQLLAAGATRTLNSRHLTGHAVDLAAMVDGEVRWDWPLYAKLATIVKSTAKDVGTPIEWGGDWKFRDGPHFQLPWADFPLPSKTTVA